MRSQTATRAGHLVAGMALLACMGAGVVSAQIEGEASGLRVETDRRGHDGIELAEWLPRGTNLVKVVISRHGFGGNPAGGTGRGKAPGKNKPQPTPGAGTAAATASATATGTGGRKPEPEAGTGGRNRKTEAGTGDRNRRPEPETGSRNRKPDPEAGAGPGAVGGDRSGKRGGKTEAEGGVADAYASTLTGQDHGNPEGGKGGDGQPGDAGARGAFALFGGILNVPRAWRPAVEVAFIGSEVMTPSSAFKSVFRKGLRRMSTRYVRKQLRRKSRSFARREVKRMKAQFADELGAMTRSQRKSLLTATGYQKQRQFFEKVEDGAKNRRRHLQRKLRDHPADRKLMDELEDVKKLEEAAAVKPVEGRFPVNHEYAGKTLPVGNIDARKHAEAVQAIRDKGLPGVRFTRDGYPDFKPWIHKESKVAADVRIEYSGLTRSKDFIKARDAMRAKLGDPTWLPPAKHTWHHSEDVGRMLLVPRELHDAVRHTGGVSMYRMTTGDFNAYQRAAR